MWWISGTHLFLSLSIPLAVSARHVRPGLIERDGSNVTQLTYQNSDVPIEERLDDLMGRMTLEEKVGQMFQEQINLPDNGTVFVEDMVDQFISSNLLTHFNLAGSITNVRIAVEFMNELQRRAGQTRLGIPISFSTDPRHSFTDNIGTGYKAGAFSEWPESLGLAALRDPALVRTFADIAREEYVAVGLRGALHPQIDLATEPRWARIRNTFGEDAQLSADMVTAYIKGFQGETLGRTSVSTVTKHFPGAGAMENGEDSHFPYGKNQSYPGNNWEYFLVPFKAAIKAGARQMMPYYSRPVGTHWEEVGFAFNKEIVTDLLQTELGFTGIITSDWGLITDGKIPDFPAQAWGVENYTEIQRAERILNAGCDQFGGETRTELVIQLVEEGRIQVSRIDKSVRKILREKFLLGLFDNAIVDAEAAERIVGNEYFYRLGQTAQRHAYTLLTNKNDVLPLKAIAGTKFYIEGFNASSLIARNMTVVKTPREADFALLRLEAPYEPREKWFETFFHAGSLEFNSTEKARQEEIYRTVPTIVDMLFDRPAVVPEIAQGAAALLGNFGSNVEALLDVVLGVAAPKGKLPFDLPSSMDAVINSMPDVPYDTRNPVFKFGHGLTYHGPRFERD